MSQGACFASICIEVVVAVPCLHLLALIVVRVDEPGCILHLMLVCFRKYEVLPQRIIRADASLLQQIVASNSSTSDSDVMCCVSGVESGFFTAKSSPSAYSLAALVVEAVLCAGHKCRFTHSCLFAKCCLLFVCLLSLLGTRTSTACGSGRTSGGTTSRPFSLWAPQSTRRPIAQVGLPTYTCTSLAFLSFHIIVLEHSSLRWHSLCFSFLFFLLDLHNHIFVANGVAPPPRTDVCARVCFFHTHVWLKSRRRFRGAGPTSAVRWLTHSLFVG
jgi:hypothetical protein